MPAEPETQSKPFFRNPTLYTSRPSSLLCCSRWILFSRWLENRAIESRAKEKNAKATGAGSHHPGTTRWKGAAIQNFYATPGVNRRGETVQICLWCGNAKTDDLKPQPNAVWPSYSRASM